MKERTKNILGYGAMLSAALLLAGGILAGSYSLHARNNAANVDEVKNKLFRESIIRYAEQLQTSNNPRDLVVAAQLLDFHEMVKEPDQLANPMHVEQLKRAVTLSPKDADIAWLEAMGCGRLKAACNRENAVSRLQHMQPDNLAVHLLAFNQADTAANDAQRLTALQAMANSRYSDIHYFSLGKLYLEALRGWHPPTQVSAYDAFGDDIDQSPITDDEQRKVMAAGYSIAVALPALQHITTYCKNENLTSEELHNCQKIAKIMIKDNTLIMHRIGLRIGVAVFKQEPAAGQWREAYRVSYWQLSGHHPNRKKQYSERKYFNAWPNIDEMTQQRQRLIDKGIPLTPPKGWMPESEEIQKLLKAPIATNP
jgi:hypothetical protein